MIKFKIFVIFVVVVFTQMSYASDCAGVTLEQAFKENKLIVFADIISTKLTQKQFIEHYLLQRKGLKGFDKAVHMKKAKEGWLEYEKNFNFTHFLVKGVVKAEAELDTVIKIIDTQDTPFQTGKTYILFLSNPYKNQDVFLADSCVYFNFTDRKYIQEDQRFSKSGTFEGALDELMLYRDAKVSAVPSTYPLQTE